MTPAGSPERLPCIPSRCYLEYMRKHRPRAFAAGVGLTVAIWLLTVSSGTPRLAPRAEPAPARSSDTGAALDTAPAPAVVTVRSDPDSATVFLDGTRLPGSTPLQVPLAAGEHLIEVMKEDYDPLSYELDVLPAETVTVVYYLKSLPPTPLLPESLGLSYLPVRKRLDSLIADRQMQTYVDAAQTFAVFPFGQGLIVRLFLGDTHSREANVMMIGGAVMSLGALIMGKTITNRKREQIRAENERIQRENESATLHNREVDRVLREATAARMESWRRRNASRGRVEVIRNTPER